ncbi:hypothetical protein CBL_13919 [Carabus blaptoides fortunei]
MIFVERFDFEYMVCRWCVKIGGASRLTGGAGSDTCAAQINHYNDPVHYIQSELSIDRDWDLKLALPAFPDTQTAVYPGSIKLIEPLLKELDLKHCYYTKTSRYSLQIYILVHGHGSGTRKDGCMKDVSLRTIETIRVNCQLSQVVGRFRGLGAFPTPRSTPTPLPLTITYPVLSPVPHLYFYDCACPEYASASTLNIGCQFRCPAYFEQIFFYRVKSTSPSVLDLKSWTDSGINRQRNGVEVYKWL